ncbi:MAG: hypothetical protein HQL87_14570 [Magnetococcales bacterium]|nr:hypothetical protein [Magnetococcales bacterium]
MSEHKVPHIRLVPRAGFQSSFTKSASIVPELQIVTVSSVTEEVGGDKPSAQIDQRKPQQLSLPFDDRYSVALINVNRKDIHWFLDLLRSMAPELIIDTRSVARLDVLCGTRENAFRVFEAHSVEYIDLFGRLGITTYQADNAQPDYWCSKIVDIIPNIPKVSRPVLVVFDNQELLNSSVYSISSEFRKLFKHEISLSIKSS